MLSLHDVSVQRGAQIICEHLNWQVLPGQIWAVLGRNGVGKTSLLHSLTGLYPLTHGQVLLDQQNIQRYAPKQRAQLIGILLQQAETSLSNTVLQILQHARFPYCSYWGLHLSNDNAIMNRCLKLMQLQALQHRQFASLSGGERQRLRIASLLVQQPRVYVLDEPTNHLDMAMQIQVLKHLQYLAAQGHTIIMSLQDINLASRFCTHALLLFGKGQQLAGDKQQVLQHTHLEKLYQHPLQCVKTSQGLVWLAI